MPLVSVDSRTIPSFTPLERTRRVWVLTPLPVRETLSGLEAASEGMEAEPVFGPTESGEKVTLKVQVADGAIVALEQVSLLRLKSPVEESAPR